jgi:hypothetical protein
MRQPIDRLPYRSIPPTVVLLELCRIAEQARSLYISDNWELVRSGLSEQSRADTVQALNAVAFIARTMAEDLENSPTNYGVQRERRRVLDRRRSLAIGKWKR